MLKVGVRYILICILWPFFTVLTAKTHNLSHGRNFGSAEGICAFNSPNCAAEVERSEGLLNCMLGMLTHDLL